MPGSIPFSSMPISEKQQLMPHVLSLLYKEKSNRKLHPFVVNVNQVPIPSNPSSLAEEDEVDDEDYEEEELSSSDEEDEQEEIPQWSHLQFIESSGKKRRRKN